MIKLLQNEDMDFANEYLSIDIFEAITIHSLIITYGFDRPFFDVWVQLEDDGITPLALIARLDTSFFLYAPNDFDYNEMADFLNMQPQISQISADIKTIFKIADLIFDAKEFDAEFCVMQDFSKLVAQSMSIDKASILKEIYHVVSACMDGLPPYDAWSADFIYRGRKGCARAYLVRIKDKPVACACTFAESPHIALIGGVATLPKYRGQGLASQLVSACYQSSKM